MFKNFEEFLKEKHSKEYHGCDDDMPDSFENWLCNLTPDDWIILGGMFAEVKTK